MVGRPAGSSRACGARALLGALAAIALCASSALGAADGGAAAVETADTAAESCETGKAHGGSLSAWIVLQWTLVMALARCVGQARASVRRRICLSLWLRRHSGLGAVPFFLIPPEKLNGELVGAANAVAAGVTLAASFGTQTRARPHCSFACGLRRTTSRSRYAVVARAGMLYEGVYSEDFQGHYLMVVLGMFLGYAFIALCEAKLDDKEYSLGELSGANAKRAMLVLLIMTMHSFAEGLGVGVSWAGSNGDVKGQFVTAAIGVHNIPEGMTVALLMMPVSKSRTHSSHVWQTSVPPRAICALSPVLDSSCVDFY